MSRFSDDFPGPLPNPDDWDDYCAMMDAAPEIPCDAFDNIAAGLTDSQIDAASHQGAILVLAGAGTGKTSALTAAIVHRIAVDKIAAPRILAVTFTNKAAKEMETRIRGALAGRAAPSWIGTYHGLAARQLRASPEVAGLRPNFDILDADDSRRVIKRVMKAHNLAVGDEEIRSGRDPIKQVCNRISKWKDNLITPRGAADSIDAKIIAAQHSRDDIDVASLRAAARVYADYQKSLRDANAADFGDLLLWPTLAMRNNLDYRRQWSDKFDWVHADEYQDVNFAQYSWLRYLGERHQRIFVVGDDDQSIYSWRGSDIAFIRRFAQDFKGAIQIRLEENFRSTGHILNAANAVIAQDKKRLGKTLFTRKGAGEKIEILSYRDAQAEAAGIAAEIVHRHSRGDGWDAMSILYRNNFISRAFEEALMRHRVPYVLVGDVGFYARAEIKDALALLRLSETPDEMQSDEAFRRVINEPKRGFGAKAMQILEAEAAQRGVSLLRALDTALLPPKTQSAGRAFAAQIRQVADNASHTVADQITLLLDVTGYRAMLRDSKAEETEDRLENLAELISLAGGFHTVRDLLDHTALATNRPDEDESGAVRLMTLHKAKGLEFPHVFLPAFESGVIPSDYGDLDEERRLAYVALTRGKQKITISYAGFRRGPASPSPFLDDIPEETCIKGSPSRALQEGLSRFAFKAGSNPTACNMAPFRRR